MIQKLFFALNLLRGIPAWAALWLSGAAPLVRRETEGYSWFPGDGKQRCFFAAFQLLMWKYSPYRNQVIYRCSQRSSLWGYGIRLLYPIKKDLEIGGSIGRNRRPGQERDIPIIGNNVSVYTNAVVAGGITIGDNVRIAAGAVVLQDVPSNSLVYGNPCVIRPQKS